MHWRCTVDACRADTARNKCVCVREREKKSGDGQAKYLHASAKCYACSGAACAPRIVTPATSSYPWQLTIHSKQPTGRANPPYYNSSITRIRVYFKDLIRKAEFLK